MDLKIKTFTCKRYSILSDEENAINLKRKVQNFMNQHEITKPGVFYYVIRKQKLRLCADIYIRIYESDLKDLILK